MKKNKYVTLLKNTSIFAIGTFSSKILSMLMMRFYTGNLGTDFYGVADIVVNTCNFIIPIVTLCITDAILRYGLDRSNDKSDVFSTGLLVLGGGFLFLLLFIPVFLGSDLAEYTVLIYIYILASSFNSICSHFVRARGLVKLFAVSGIYNTLIMITSNIVLLGVFNTGVKGYVLSIIIADLITGLTVFWIASLKKYVKFKGINKAVAKSMIIFALPLIPSTVFWWIINLSDRYMLTYILGSGEGAPGTIANSLYTAAYKVPTMITTISGIVMSAWRISSFTEDSSEDRSRFYSNVFISIQAAIYLCSTFIILLAKPITTILTGEGFYDAWSLMPLLTLSVIYQCFAAFMANIYMVVKKNKMALITTMIGAFINVGLNIVLIPKFGAAGAAFTTFVSCLFLFVSRWIDSRRFIKFDVKPLFLLVNFILLVAQTIISMSEIPLWYLYEGIICALVVVINIRPMWRMLKNVLRRRRKAG